MTKARAKTNANFNEIYRVSIDGGIPEQFTSEGKFEVAPTWSPDGASIEFQSRIISAAPRKRCKARAFSALNLEHH
jgi:Tol biopolymer transport system component